MRASEIHTDEFPGYWGLNDEYQHKIINHLEGYVKEDVHKISEETCRF